MAASTMLTAALGWALLDFLWQGLAIGALAALGLLALRNARPQARYLTTICPFIPPWPNPQ